MKAFLPLLFFSVIYSTQLTAQCQISNGSFEEWTDYTDSFEHELGLQLTHPVIMPTDWFSLVRLLDIALSGFIIEYLDKDTLDLPVFDAIKQYSPGANNTNFAARISGDSLLLVSDLIQFTECAGRPEKLSGYFKYEGEGLDTLQIGVILHHGELVDTADAIGYASFSTVGTPIDISRGTADYLPFSVDFVYNSEEIPDTATILIISVKDGQNRTDTSFFVVDELAFEGGVVPTYDVYQEAPYALIPNPTSDFLRLNLEYQGEASLEIFDALGMEVLKINPGRHHSISVAHLPAGTYITRIQADKKVYWQKIIINH